ncbi:Hypothetical predicted protein [Olea europaea subsp. europaea]|uniref:Uncharacterized protein n=1 Tax=Olea europaea subsp. europaea TaxID=158383 RepID=A0A8S0TK18_OLEEU|nr:Hypothetical predicted protein [Olea europaea subsp. europaea]
MEFTINWLIQKNKLWKPVFRKEEAIGIDQNHFDPARKITLDSFLEGFFSNFTRRLVHLEMILLRLLSLPLLMKLSSKRLKSKTPANEASSSGISSFDHTVPETMTRKKHYVGKNSSNSNARS